MSVSQDVLVVSFFAIVSFSCLNKSLDYVSAPVKYTDQSRRHKWRNCVVSLIHAMIAGIGGIYCLTSSPELLHDKLNVFRQQAEHFLAISAGYLIYDAIDLFQHNAVNKIVPQVAHHILVLLFLYLVFSTRQLYGMTVVCMLIELSGVFLHIRILLLMHDFKKQGIIWNVNAFLNIFTFFVFRMGILGYLFVWVLVHNAECPAMFALLGPWVTGGVFILNLELLRRLITSDYLSKTSSEKLNQSILES